MSDNIQARRNHRAPWTVKDIQFVEASYGRLPTKAIAATLGRGISAVRKVAQASGVGKPTPRPWTDEELALIREHYDEGLTRVHALLPGRTKLAINAQACNLGVTKADWSEQEREYLRTHYGKMPTDEIAAILGRRMGGLRSMVREMGLGRKAKTPGRPWTEQELSILRAHYGRGAWIVNVQTLLPGRTRGAIGTQASKIGLTRSQTWHPDEVSILRRFYPEAGAKVAEKLPGRTVVAVNLQAAKLGLRYRTAGR